MVGDAGSGREALRLTKSLAPDLVLADIYMPDLDGLEVARYIREHFSGMKVILVSAAGGQAYERLAAEEGALAFIPKADLSLDALRRVLQRGKRR